SERCEMPSQSLPAASLRATPRLPAARVLLRVASYLICLVLSAIATAISSVKSSFLPALRDAPNRLRQLRSADAEQFCRDAPMIAMRSSSERPASVKIGLGSLGPSA